MTATFLFWLGCRRGTEEEKTQLGRSQARGAERVWKVEGCGRVGVATRSLDDAETLDDVVTLDNTLVLDDIVDLDNAVPENAAMP